MKLFTEFQLCFVEEKNTTTTVIKQNVLLPMPYEKLCIYPCFLDTDLIEPEQS